MILGVDPGYAKCGWSIVEPGTARVVDLGLITTKKRAGLHPSADRAKRIDQVCDKLAELAHTHKVDTIAAEQALEFGNPTAIVANVMPWGAVVMLARMIKVALFEVQAKVWQCAVLGVDPKQKFKRGQRYALVEKALTKYVGKQLADALADLDKADRRHPLDSTGAAMLAALMPQLATRIIERKDVTA